MTTSSGIAFFRVRLLDPKAPIAVGGSWPEEVVILFRFLSIISDSYLSTGDLSFASTTLKKLVKVS